MPSCQDFSKRLPELESRLAAEYAGTPIPDIKAAQQAVFQKAGLTTPRWLAGLRWKVIALIVSILAGLFYFGRSYDIFMPFDARSTTIPAATATPLPAADAAFPTEGSTSADSMLISIWIWGIRSSSMN
jgi:hypothetical protein